MDSWQPLISSLMGLLFAFTLTGWSYGFGPVIWVRRAVGRSRARRDDRDRRDLIERVRQLVPQARDENTIFSIHVETSTRGGSQFKITTNVYHYSVFVAETGRLWVIPFYFDRKEKRYELGNPVSLSRELVQNVEITGRPGKQQTVTFWLKREVGLNQVVMVLEPFLFRKNRFYPFDLFQEEACEQAMSAAESIAFSCGEPEEDMEGERSYPPSGSQWNMSAAHIPLKRRFRAYFLKRFVVSLVWTVLWCGAWVAGIEFFYGPGEGLISQMPYLMGGLIAIGMVGLFASVGLLIARLVSLLTFTGALRRSMGEKGDPYAILEEDIRYRVMDVSDIYLGCDWIVFPGHAMRRDQVTGIYLEKLSQSYLSRKTRVRVFDDSRRDMMYLDLAPRQHPDQVYAFLAGRHPRAKTGTWQRRQSVQTIADFQAKREEAPAPLGISRWDRSPILEENYIRGAYERWILTTYCVFVAADPYCDGDFSRVGGYERTEYQKRCMLGVLEDAWDIRSRRELLETVGHLVQTGRQRRDGWQLGRAPMVLGFGYIGGLICRAELLEYSLGAAKAIQESFSSWQELFDSHMLGFEAWAKGNQRMIDRRREAYQRVRKDPSSLMNTVDFHANVEPLCWDVMDRLGVRR
ncbi:MAG: DUF1266 domain-containing protein [Oscillospiraceae bacterium]|nr:DUF1266 domain-containing protein [Oscillospiraceae bacterium]